MDAYQRAAELDPNNVHIKARLQLLRNGQTNGMPGQPSAPLPQDVHPQAYQASGAVGPPAPQWGSSAPQAAPPGPNGPPANGWGGSRLADINPPPQPGNPYDQRDPARGPIPPPPRAPSPRQEQQLRQYNDPSRAPPPPPPPASGRRTPPREHHAHMGPYPGTNSLPQPPPPPAAPSQPQRVANPNYAGPSPSATLPPANNQLNGSAPGPLPPFGRGSSPRPEVRPLMDTRMTSPKSGYAHQQYHHPDGSNPGGIESGAPAPASAMAASEAAALDRNNERPGSVGPKRMREWEEEPAPKKPASDENRARMEDVHHRRTSTPPRDNFRRSSSEMHRNEDTRRLEDQRRTDEQRRLDDQRRANENYHPSEAAHHPPPHALPPNHLPPISQSRSTVTELPPPPPPPSASKEYPPEERERLEQAPQPAASQTPQMSEPERAARKMDVDEDYDDDAEDEKKATIVAAPGSAHGSTASEQKTLSPTANSHTNGVTKAEVTV